MDSNQTRLQLLLGRDDWARCKISAAGTTLDGDFILPPEEQGESSALFTWNPAGSELTLGTRINVFRSSLGNRVPSIEDRRDAAADQFGNVYWIADSQTEILVRSSGTYANDHFWSSTDEDHTHAGKPGGFTAVPPVTQSAPLTFSGLTVTQEQYLAVGSVQPAGLVVFDLLRGGPPRQFVWPDNIRFTPFAMAAAVGGGVWILDRDNARLWQLDRTFAVVRSNSSEVEVAPGVANVFSPAGEHPCAGPKTFPTGISLHSASPLQSIDAIAMTVLPDNTVLLLESDPATDFSLIYRLRDGLPIGTPVSLDIVKTLLEPDDAQNFRLLGFDFAFIAKEQTPMGARQNTLYVVGQNGDQAWAFVVDYSADQLVVKEALPDYYPMRLFGGRALAIGVSQVLYDSRLNWVPLIMQKRPRFVEDAALVTFIMDGKQPDCVWDRLMLDGAIPPDTQIVISSRAGNDPIQLQSQPWFTEPLPYMRDNGTELPWTPQPAGVYTWELLFQNAVGQYLQLKLELQGNRQLTPRLRALRAWYPRFSYLQHYLPGVYRDDEQSAWFVDRLLCNFEGFYTSIEDRVATVQALFDPASAPSETLDWLANWFGVALDPSWPDAKRRLFISNAATFFEARGTVPGLMMALRLTLEDCADQGIFTKPVSPWGVRLVEKYQKRWLPLAIRQGPADRIVIPSSTQVAKWTPDLGADELNRRYAPLQSPSVPYPIYLPPTDAQYKQWSAFSLANLGVVPGVPDSGSDLWPTFLSGRYRTIGQLNSAYGTAWSSFTQVPFPRELPRRTVTLWDWYQFQGILLVEAGAHQFTVFLPMKPADAQSVAAQRSKLGLAQRVIDLEKPAHTSYDLQFYWAFFRVGDARLGRDSVLDAGSRAPQLMLPALVGDTYLGLAYLSRDPQPRPFLKGSC